MQTATAQLATEADYDTMVRFADADVSSDADLLAGAHLASPKSSCDCGRQVCGCDGGPGWFIGSNVVAMQRSEPDAFVIAENTTDPTRTLNANEFDFEYAPGWDLTVGRESCRGGFEARFLRVDSWRETAVLAPNTGLGSPLRINSATPFTVTLPVDTVATFYESDLNSFEFNVHRPLGKRWKLIAGFRYLELDEHLHADISVVPLATSFTYDTMTRNRLYGGQLGGEFALGCCGGLELDAVFKAGVYGNSVRNNSEINVLGGLFPAADSTDQAAFLGEFAIRGRYCLGRGLYLTASYQLMWIDGVALATDQIPVTDFTAEDGIDANGDVFYHGGLFGLEYRR